MFRRPDLEEGNNESGRDSANGEIDIEAPAPCHIISEDTSDLRRLALGLCKDKHTISRKGHTSGPTAEATPKVAAFTDWKAGAFSGGTRVAIMTRDPVNRAAAPTPAIALPAIKTADEGATAEINEPTSNMNNAQRKIHFAEYRE
jgi:hypothetical protein